MATKEQEALVRRVTQFYKDVHALVGPNPPVNARPYLDLYEHLVKAAGEATGQTPPFTGTPRIEESGQLAAVVGLLPYVGQLLIWLRDATGYDDGSLML